MKKTAASLFGAMALALALPACAASAQAPEGKMNILCVCGHPCDVDMNCGGTLLRYRKAGHRIFIALTTGGNAVGGADEALASAKAYGAEVRVLGADEGRLLDTNEMRTKILDALRWADPDVVFTHSPDDESPDHRMTSRLVRSMILSLPGVNQQSCERPCTKKVSVFTWENDACVGSGQPEAYVDISDVMDEKLKTFRLHRSQVGYMDTFGIEIDDDVIVPDRLRGLQVGCKYAECFNAFRIHGYMPDFGILP